MAAHVRTVMVTDADRREFQRRARSKGVLARVVERARIVLLAADGVPGKQIAARVGCAEPTVVTWRRRYAQRGLAGLADLPRPGSPPPLPARQRVADDGKWRGAELIRARQAQRLLLARGQSDGQDRSRSGPFRPRA
jgi:hypothetical protein